MSKAIACTSSFLMAIVLVGTLQAVPSLPGADGRVIDTGPEDKVALLHTVMNSPEAVFQKFRQVCLKDFQHPEHLRVTIHETPTSRLMGGYFSAMELDARGGGVDYVRLDSLRLRCEGVHFDLEKLMFADELHVRRVDKMELALTVSEDAFNEVFRSHAGRLRVKNPIIKMYDGELAFSGSVKAFLLQSRIHARGPLELTPDGRVNFNLRRLQVSGINLPGIVVEQIAKSVNPITDFRKFKFWDCWNMSLRSVVVREGSLTLSSFADDVPPVAAVAAAPADVTKPPVLSKPGVYVFE